MVFLSPHRTRDFHAQSKLRTRLFSETYFQKAGKIYDLKWGKVSYEPAVLFYWQCLAAWKFYTANRFFKKQESLSQIEDARTTLDQGTLNAHNNTPSYC